MNPGIPLRSKSVCTSNMNKQGPLGQGGSGECRCSQDDSLGTPKRLVKTWNWGFVSLQPGLERHPTKADNVDEISKVTPTHARQRASPQAESKDPSPALPLHHLPKGCGKRASAAANE